MILYHGTCRASWAQTGEGSPLHLTRDRELARDYALECRESWLLDYADSDAYEAIVIAFDMSELSALDGVAFLPTTGAKELMRVTDWRECFDKTGALSVAGFDEKHKGLGSIEKV